MNKEEIKNKYDGKSLNDYKRIGEISYYNHNYYIGEKNCNGYDLLYGVCDDCGSTDLFLVIDRDFILFGECLGDGDIIYVCESFIHF